MIRRVAFLALLLALALPAMAGDYATITVREGPPKPPVTGAFLAGPVVNWTDRPGIGGVFGYQWYEPGVTLLFGVEAAQLKGSSGTTEFRRFCQTYKVPYSVGNRTATEFSATVLFTLKTKR